MSWFGANSLSVTQAAAAMETGSVLIDVRTAAEWKDARPRGARHIPMQSLPNAAGKLDGEDVLVICRSGNRSGRAARWLRKQGIAARNVKGGLIAWQRHQLPVDSGAKNRSRRNAR